MYIWCSELRYFENICRFKLIREIHDLQRQRARMQSAISMSHLIIGYKRNRCRLYVVRSNKQLRSIKHLKAQVLVIQSVLNILSNERIASKLK